ncbi:MAG TPA: flavin reductase family protein [Actinomycetota bacterium]|nr:flavin reductase family protein [Actinomycetota bacterium]
MSGDEGAFDAIASHLDYPMFIVTAADGERRGGCLVGFATQCCIDPPRFVVFISKNNFTYEVASAASHLAIHVVPGDAEDLARLFGEETGDRVDKFERLAFDEGPGGTPLLKRCPDRFAGRVIGRVDGGDHEGFVVEVDHAWGGGGSFFPFSRAREFEPGHDA